MTEKTKPHHHRHSCIGIHYSGSAITAVMVDTHHPDRGSQATVTVVPTNSEKKPFDAAEMLAELKAKMSLENSKLPVALALGGRLYQTGRHHSEFDDTHQIDQTLRFDIEEEFMVEAENVAVCYQIQPAEQTEGADLIVSLASRDDLQNLFQQFDHAALDAHIAQPDLAAWISYLRQHVDAENANMAFVAWSNGVLYTLILDPAYYPILSRSYLCPDENSIDEVLQRELNRAMVLLAHDQQPKILAYHAEHINAESIKAFAASAGLQPQVLPNADPAEAFAIGAALSWSQGNVFTDFRRLDLQPRTLVAGKMKAIYGLAAAVTVLLLAWSLIMYLQMSGYERFETQTDQNMIAAWDSVRPGQKLRNPAQLPRSMRVLRSEVAQNIQGQSHDMLPDSAARMIFLVLQALDNLPEDFDLQLESIRTGADYAMLSGSVPNLSDRALIDSVIENQPRLVLNSWDFTQDSAGAGRRSFNMSLGITAETAP